MIKKFWLGQTPMWINVWILGLVFFRLLLIGVIMVLDKFGLGPILIMDIVMYGLLPLYIIWGIATWRSAQIYKGRKLWSSLTELFVIIKCGSALLALFVGLGFMI